VLMSTIMRIDSLSTTGAWIGVAAANSTQENPPAAAPANAAEALRKSRLFICNTPGRAQCVYAINSSIGSLRFILCAAEILRPMSPVGQGRPASFASTLKVQRSPVGSGSGRPGRVWPMSQLGREPSSDRVINLQIFTT
jgi:hypothetical protein